MKAFFCDIMVTVLLLFLIQGYYYLTNFEDTVVLLLAVLIIKDIKINNKLKNIEKWKRGLQNE